MPPALFALLLAAAQPAAASAQPAPAPAEAAAAADPEASPDRIPAGAPRDDYAFVAWCKGVLSGHMDLAERIKDVLPLDPLQQEIGKAYLAAYDKALDGAKESRTKAGRRRAELERRRGWDNWNAARRANKKLAEDTYLNWEEPGRCEHAAIRLSHDPALFRLSPSVQAVIAKGEAEEQAEARARAVAVQASAAQPAPDAVAAAAPAPAPPPSPADELKIKTLPDAPADTPDKPDPKTLKEQNFDRFWNEQKPGSPTTGPQPQ